MEVTDVLPRDSIPSIDDPTFGETYIGEAEDEVIVVEGDPPRAYPIRILSYHEIANDEVDGEPIAVTWCPICWSGVVYERSVDGRTLTFGMSGKLADDALVMYDRETESEWKQPTGEAFSGPLAGSRLTALASPMIPWAAFRETYPDGVVLQPVRGTEPGSPRAPREIYQMEPYERYVERDAFGLYGMRGDGTPRSWDRDDLPAKAVVLGVELDGDVRAYPVGRVESAGGAVRDRLGAHEIVVATTDEGVHAFAAPDFELAGEGGELRGDGTSWDPVTGDSGDGRSLARIPARRMFAFAWQDAHGADAFFDPASAMR